MDFSLYRNSHGVSPDIKNHALRMYGVENQIYQFKWASLLTTSRCLLYDDVVDVVEPTTNVNASP